MPSRSLEVTNAPATPELSGPGLPLCEAEAQPPTAQSQPETQEQPKEPWPVRLVRKYGSPPYNLSEADCLAILGAESWDEWAKNGGTGGGADLALENSFAGSGQEDKPDPAPEPEPSPDNSALVDVLAAEDSLETRAWDEFKYTRQDIFNALSKAANLSIKSWDAWYAAGFGLDYAWQMIAGDCREANRTEAEKDLDSIFPPAGEDGHPGSAAEVISDVLETQDDLPF